MPVSCAEQVLLPFGPWQRPEQLLRPRRHGAPTSRQPKWSASASLPPTRCSPAARPEPISPPSTRRRGASVHAFVISSNRMASIALSPSRGCGGECRTRDGLVRVDDLAARKVVVGVREDGVRAGAAVNLVDGAITFLHGDRVVAPATKDGVDVTPLPELVVED